MQMSIGKLAVLVVAVGLAFGGIGAAIADWREADAGDPVQLAADVDARKNDADDDLAAAGEDDEGDGDDTAGDDGTGGGANTGDGDNTAGNDGTGGSANTRVAPSGDTGGGDSGGGDSGGGDT
ncbi:MAG TPA: hypothetical protein VK874_06825 [Gaiellaceae bacterium]|nr:hypothetical protein [Gaiellaceae bacterium]